MASQGLEDIVVAQTNISRVEDSDNVVRNLARRE